jgi:hypothetical protein
MDGMAMRMAMLSANAFGARVWEQGPRGTDAFAVPDWVMGELGTSAWGRHYLSVNVMLTAEKWLFPDAGYPELAQIGETNAAGAPFIDAQHPHSSPIMGLTFADTIGLGEGGFLKLSFAPRGEALDGPIPFMHRETGEVNPDAPLGHHIGQDVGHVSSTVLGASLKLGSTRVDVSAFHGAEPEPENVDLPLGAPDSLSARVIEELAPEWLAMASLARVNAPEPDEPSVLFETRASASVYWHHGLGTWTYSSSLILGAIAGYDAVPWLVSFADEFLLSGGDERIWGRVEVLERTASELGVSEATGPRWIAAGTLGYTHRFFSASGVDLGLGGSLTKTLMPGDLLSAYGGNPWSGKVFAQLSLAFEAGAF